MPDPIIKHNLNDIQSLSQLNDLIGGEKDINKIVSVKWASRDFTFKGNDLNGNGTEYHVKMKDIVAKFKELSQKELPKNLNDIAKKNDSIHSIHDRLTELNTKGDYLLRQEGIGANFFRDIKNIFTRSHAKQIDQIEEKTFSEFAAKLGDKWIKHCKDTYEISLAGILLARLSNPEKVIEDIDINTVKDAFRYIAHKEPIIAYRLLDGIVNTAHYNNIEFKDDEKQFIDSQFYEIFNHHRTIITDENMNWVTDKNVYYNKLEKK